MPIAGPTQRSARSVSAVPPVRSRTTRSVRATSSVRSSARPAQNNASAARVGTDATRSTCGSGRRRPIRTGSADPNTHMSLARAIVGSGRVVMESRALARWRRGGPRCPDRSRPGAFAGRPVDATRSRRRRSAGVPRPCLHVGEPGGVAASVCGLTVLGVASSQSPASSQSVRELGVFDDTAAVGVGEANAARRCRQEESGHPGSALGVDFHRVDAVVFESSEEHVDRFETCQRTQPQLSLAHHEVRSFGQIEAELAREERLLDEGFVVDSSRHHHDARARDVGQIGEAVAKTIDERRREAAARR